MARNSFAPSLYLVHTAWSGSNGCKSRVRPNGGKRINQDKGVVVTQGLKEVGGKLHRKTKLKLKAKLKRLTGRSRNIGYSRRKEVLTTAIRGWTGYYRHAEMHSFVLETDAWLRSKLRMCILKSWKSVKTRYRNLLRCGFEPWQARNASCARKGYWRVANSWIMPRASTTERLRRAGYRTLLEYYEKLHPHL